METFLTAFTWDLVLFTMYSLFHSAYIVIIGYIGAFLIMNKMNTYEGDGTADIPLMYGFKCMLFGVMIGSFGYMAGNVTKGTMETIMLMLGFQGHVGSDPDSEIITTTTTTTTGTTSSTTVPTSKESIPFDFESLILLQKEWFNFFAIERGMQLISPYVFFMIVEACLAGTLTLTALYM